MEYTDRPGEVADPWYTRDFEATWRDVNDGCRGLLTQLREHMEGTQPCGQTDKMQFFENKPMPCPRMGEK